MGPDRDTRWNKARAWVEGVKIAGGGWRMPTVDELKALYERGKGDRNMTPLLKTTGWWVWSRETKGSSDAWFFNFPSGTPSLLNRVAPLRAFGAVQQMIWSFGN